MYVVKEWLGLGQPLKAPGLFALGEREEVSSPLRFRASIEPTSASQAWPGALGSAESALALQQRSGEPVLCWWPACEQVATGGP